MIAEDFFGGMWDGTWDEVQKKENGRVQSGVRKGKHGCCGREGKRMIKISAIIGTRESSK